MKAFFKRTLGCMIGGILVLAVPAGAHPPVTVFVDGQAVTFDQPPVIIDDRTLVPMRAIFQALGSAVAWSEPTQTITSTRGTDTVTLKIGDTGVYKNGELMYTMPVPARIINERTLVPIRAVAVAMDAAVGWDGIGYVVTISSQDRPASSGDYTTEVKAEDGTTVLLARITYPGDGGEQADALSGEALRMGEGFVGEYSDKAKAAYAKAKAAGQTFSPYSYVGAYEITAEDSQYVSFYGTFTQYTGGTENHKLADSHTYSVKNGKEVVLEDILSDSTQEIEEMLTASFQEIIGARTEGFYDDAPKRLEKHLAEVGFYLTPQGIGFYLQPETLAPLEAGIIGFTVEHKR